jgi:Flp pilus assembly protein TadG
MIEFAFVLPVFLLIGWGATEFGQALHAGRLLSEKAREAAHQTADGVPVEDVQADVRDSLGRSLNAAPSAIDVAIQAGPATHRSPATVGFAATLSREAVDVRIRLDYDEVAWVSGGFLSGTELEGHCRLLR